MGNRAIESMQHDMRVFPYIGEDQELYAGRLVYSALCHWLRYCILDGSFEETPGKSKVYVLKRGKDILSTLLRSVPEAKGWMADSDDDVVRRIRDRMIRANELLESKEDNRLYLPKHCIFQCGNNVIREVGLPGDTDFEHSGVTRIKSVNHTDYTRFDLDLKEYVDQIYSEAKWISTNDISRFDFFDPNSANPPYKSWNNRPSDKLHLKLARLELFNGQRDYYLVKEDRGNYLISRIPESLQEMKEERRIILGLRYMACNPINAYYTFEKRVVILKFLCRLPIEGENYVETFSWPMNNYADKMNYVVPFKMWDEIQAYIQNSLGIILRERS